LSGDGNTSRSENHLHTLEDRVHGGVVLRIIVAINNTRTHSDTDVTKLAAAVISGNNVASLNDRSVEEAKILQACHERRHIQEIKTSIPGTVVGLEAALRIIGRQTRHEASVGNSTSDELRSAVTWLGLVGLHRSGTIHIGTVPVGSCKGHNVVDTGSFRSAH